MATAATIPSALASVLGWRGVTVTANDGTTSAGLISTTAPDPVAAPFLNEGPITPTMIEAMKSINTAQSLVTTIGALPAAVSSKGIRATVTDANLGILALGGLFGSTLTAGGSTTVPVWCDGTNWRIG